MRVTRAPTAVSNLNYIDCNCTLVKKNFDSWHFLIIVVTSGYTFKENLYCGGILTNHRSNLNDAVNTCNSNSQCKCIDHTKSGSYYWTYESATPYADSRFDAWVIIAI